MTKKQKNKAAKPKKTARQDLSFPNVNPLSQEQKQDLARSVIAGSVYNFDSPAGEAGGGLVRMFLGEWVHGMLKKHGKKKFETWASKVIVLCDATGATRAINGVPFAMGWFYVLVKDWHDVLAILAPLFPQEAVKEELAKRKEK